MNGGSIYELLYQGLCLIPRKIGSMALKHDMISLYCGGEENMNVAIHPIRGICLFLDLKINICLLVLISFLFLSVLMDVYRLCKREAFNAGGTYASILLIIVS